MKLKYKVGDVIKLGYTYKDFAEIIKVIKSSDRGVSGLILPSYEYKVKYLFGISGTMSKDYQEKIEVVSEFDIIGTHLKHCNLGEYVNYCKYGDNDCPALREEKIRKKKLFSIHHIKVWFPVAEENEEKAIEVLEEKLSENFNKNEFTIV